MKLVQCLDTHCLLFDSREFIMSKIYFVNLLFYSYFNK